MANTKMVPKTLGIPEMMLNRAEQIAAEWQAKRTRYEKKATWADVVRHGLGLAFIEAGKESQKRADKRWAAEDKARRGQQLSIGDGSKKKKAAKKKPAKKKAGKKKAPAKKKTAKKKPPPRPKRKPTKKRTSSKGKRK